MAAVYPAPSPVILDKLAIRAVLAAVYGAHVVEKTGYEVLKSIKVNSMTSKRQNALDEIADKRSQQENRAVELELDQYDAWLVEFQSFSTFVEERQDALELAEFRQMAELLN